MTTGLTLGKFAPFHRGHELVVRTALAEVDRLVVVVYASSLTRVPLQVRAGWIRSLYPQAEVLEAWGGPEDCGDTRETELVHEGFLKTFLAGRRIDRFYSSEAYGDHVSRSLGAEDRRVDMARALVPVSGTALRAAPYAWRGYVDPLVYRDLVARAALVGAPGTGKTRLAEALAARVGTVWMPEYGREYWEMHQVARRLTPVDLEEIARVHAEREDALALDADRWLISDTCALTTRAFALDYHGGASPRLSAAADACARRYDLFFLCGDDIPFEDTWDRSGPQKRSDFQRLVEADLLERRIPFIPLLGTLEERLDTAARAIAGFEKFGNYFGMAASAGL